MLDHLASFPARQRERRTADACPVNSVKHAHVVSNPSRASCPLADGANLLVLPVLRDPQVFYRVPPSYDIPEIHQIHLPELKRCRCVPPLNKVIYDDMEDYMQREIMQGYEFYAFEPILDVDFSPRTCWLLQ